MVIRQNVVSIFHQRVATRRKSSSLPPKSFAIFTICHLSTFHAKGLVSSEPKIQPNTSQQDLMRKLLRITFQYEWLQFPIFSWVVTSDISFEISFQAAPMPEQARGRRPAFRAGGRRRLLAPQLAPARGLPRVLARAGGPSEARASAHAAGTVLWTHRNRLRLQGRLRREAHREADQVRGRSVLFAIPFQCRLDILHVAANEEFLMCCH